MSCQARAVGEGGKSVTGGDDRRPSTTTVTRERGICLSTASEGVRRRTRLRHNYGDWVRQRRTAIDVWRSFGDCEDRRRGSR